MESNNRITASGEVSLDELKESFGNTIFNSGSATEWYKTINGIIVQGGFVNDAAADATTAVPFNYAFPKQVLGIFVQAIHSPAGAGNENTGLVAPGYTLTGFDLVNDGVLKDFFWFAIGL